MLAGSSQSIIESGRRHERSELRCAKPNEAGGVLEAQPVLACPCLERKAETKTGGEGEDMGGRRIRDEEASVGPI
jgi:hypothetical protein